MLSSDEQGQRRATAYKEPTEGAPCSLACPAGIDIPRYLRLIGRGRFPEALAVIREKIPFPSVCGRICFSPCESACRLVALDGAVAIRALKRFVAERDTGAWKQAGPVARATGKRIAIIGSGPAGLTAAYYLARRGHPVTVFEALPQPGGMMRWAIPDYRLPKDVLRTEIDHIQSTGIDIKTNTRVDSLGQLLKTGHQAIFIATGAGRTAKMGVPGEELPGVVDCLALLRQVREGKKVSLGDRVVVVGGGNSAIDAARVALRLGSRQVTLVYRRRRADMPASQLEVEQALYEGVRMQFLASPSGIKGVNRALRLECIQMRPGGLDESGRPRPEPVAGSEFGFEVDTVISAIGQVPEPSATFGLPTKAGGTLYADPDTLVTPIAGVFCGGDVVSGPASVIEAIASGRKAAISIDRHLGGSGAIDETLAPPEEGAGLGPWVPVGDRAVLPLLPVSQRLPGFAEVELSLPEEVAVQEAKRCLRCDLPILIDAAKCAGCRTCELRCSFRYQQAFNPSRANIGIHRLVGADTEYAISFTSDCDDCGICARYCPYGALSRDGAPMPKASEGV